MFGRRIGHLTLILLTFINTPQTAINNYTIPYNSPCHFDTRARPRYYNFMLGNS